MRKNNILSKAVFRLVFISLFLMISSSAAFAHKVNIFAYVEGDTVFCEGYFPDGRKVEGGKVEVYDSNKKKLTEGTTDKEGLFSFKYSKVEDLDIVIIASMGHKNRYALPAEDFSDDDTTEEAVTQADSEKLSEQKTVKTGKKHKAPEEPSQMPGILGGLGFIFGLTALIMQMSAKKKG